MKQLIRKITLPFLMIVFSHQALAAENTALTANPTPNSNLTKTNTATPNTNAANVDTIGVVNVTELFNKSTYVQKANKKLQENAKKMDDNLKAAQAKLQKQINEYQNLDNANKKEALAKKITDEQARLTKMAQEYQKRVQEEQAKGMEEFSQMVRTAVIKVAKEKNIKHVLNSTTIIYSEPTWIDISKEVSAEMDKK